MNIYLSEHLVNLGHGIVVLFVIQKTAMVSYVFKHEPSDVRPVSKEYIKVKPMQRSETEAIRTKIQPSKPKRGITKITNSQNTKRTYGQPSKQLFPKRWPLSNRNELKMI